MLVLIGSSGYARAIEESFGDAFYYSHQFGYNNQTGDRYYTITNNLFHKSDELSKHLLHPIPIGQKLTPPNEFALIDLTIGQLATGLFRDAIDVCQSSYARLTLIMHYEHIQLTIKSRAKLVVPYSDRGLHDLLNVVP